MSVSIMHPSPVSLDMGCSHTRQCSFDGQAYRQHSHQNLVRHWINDRADDCPAIPFPRYPAVQQICKASVGQQADGPGVRILQHEVSYDWACDESGKGEEVRYRVDVLVNGWADECLLRDAFIRLVTGLVVESLYDFQGGRHRGATTGMLTRSLLPKIPTEGRPIVWRGLLLLSRCVQCMAKVRFGVPYMSLRGRWLPKPADVVAQMHRLHSITGLVMGFADSGIGRDMRESSMATKPCGGIDSPCLSDGQHWQKSKMEWELEERHPLSITDACLNPTLRIDVH